MVSPRAKDKGKIQRAGGSKAADPEQYQRFLEKAKELGLDPTSETDLHRLDDVLRRVARQPSRQEQPMRGERPRGRKRPKPE